MPTYLRVVVVVVVFIYVAAIGTLFVLLIESDHFKTNGN